MSCVYCDGDGQKGRTNIWLAGKPEDKILLGTYQAITP